MLTLTGCLLTNLLNCRTVSQKTMYNRQSIYKKMLKLTTMFRKANILSTLLISITLSISNLAIANGDTQKHQHHHQTSDNKQHQHHHQTMEIPPGQPVPMVDVLVHKDAKKGWNLEVKVTNFRFAPENINTTAKPGEGHGHIYINGEKISRIYGSWYYLENLKPGKNEITVSLNANSHEALVHDGKMIADTEIIDVPVINNHQHQGK